MRKVVVAFCLSFSMVTAAQQPIPVSALGGGSPLTLQVPGAPKAPIQYAAEALASVRFLGEDVEGPSFSAGDALEVVVRSGDWVRVKKGDQYGWVLASQLSDQPPAPTLE